MNPGEFTNEIVIPTLAEFRDSPRSRRRAYLACIAVFHLKDHLEKAGESKVHDKMVATCPDEFNLVRAICNGSKHVQTNASHPIQFHIGDDYDRPPMIMGEWVIGRSRFGDEIGGREIEGQTKFLDLYHCAKSVLLTFQRLYPQHLHSCNLSDC